MSKPLYDIDQWGGQSSLIHKEKLPVALIQSIRNGILSKKLGVIKKRPRYANILTSGLTALNNMIEFVNQNDERILFIQDGTGVEKSIYSGGYGAIAAITNDERTGGSTINQIYPVLWRKELRSSAGMNASTDLPFWYGYIDAITRYPNSTAPIAISAGRYLDIQFYNDAFTDLFKSGVTDFGSYVSKVSNVGLTSNRYVMYLVPVMDGYQKGLPYTADDHSLYNRVALGISNFDDFGSIWYNLQIPTANQSDLKRLTAIDVFVADISDYGTDDLLKSPAYFLERVPLDDDGAVIMSLNGTFENTNPPTYIEFTDDFANWETFALYDLWIRFIYSGTEYEYRISTPRAENATKVQYPFTAAVAAALQNQAVECDIFARWELTGGNYEYPVIYDNNHIKLKAEMYTQLGLSPAFAGDTGLPDRRYKFSAMANKVYWIFGGVDKHKGYYSTPYAPDQIPVLNEVSIEKDATAVIPVGNDVVVTYKEGAKRFNWYGNKNVTEEENYSDRGCTNQKGWAKVNDNMIFGFDYSGPWMMTGRGFIDIGVDLIDWWGGTDSDNLSDAQKDTCVVLYNPKLQLVFFSFPDYTTAPYTAGFVAIFDLKSFKLNKGMLPWLLMDSDTAIKAGCISKDVHLLTGSATKIVDWNNASPTETCDFYLKLKLLRNALAGDVKIWWDKVRMTYSTSDTVTLTAIHDEGAGAALTLLSNDAAMIRKISQELELEFSTTASANDVEVSRVQVFGEPRSF